MKIREILEGDVIPMIPRKPGPKERVAKFRTLCPDCGKPMRGGTDTRTNKRVRICMNCYKTIDEATDPQLKAHVQHLKNDYARFHSQGYDAFRKGINREDNPHQTWLAREAWFAGWDERARDKAS